LVVHVDLLRGATAAQTLYAEILRTSLSDASG
jgi:hypothetical protein